MGWGSELRILVLAAPNVGVYCTALRMEEQRELVPSVGGALGSDSGQGSGGIGQAGRESGLYHA